LSFTNSNLIDRELLTRLTDIPVTRACKGLGASSDGKVVTHCTREENVDATVTRTSDNWTAINAIHSVLNWRLSQPSTLQAASSAISAKALSCSRFRDIEDVLSISKDLYASENTSTMP